MSDFFNNLNSNYVIIIAGFFAVYIIGVIIYMNLKKQNTCKWLKENPNAVKIYINYDANIVKMSTGTIRILSVDGKPPVFFAEKLKSGFYVNPGTHVIESTFTYSRPGVLHKNVSTTYGPAKLEIEAEALRTYNYTFDRKEETYKFEVII